MFALSENRSATALAEAWTTGRVRLYPRLDCAAPERYIVAIFNVVWIDKMALRAVNLAAVAGLAMTAATAYAQELPEGPGKAEFAATCSVCHGLEQATAQRMSRDEWGLKVNSMRAFGAEGTEEDFTKIADYLATNFGTASAAPQGSSKLSMFRPAAKR